MAYKLSDYVAQFPDREVKAGLVQAITNESVFLRLLHFIPVDDFSYSYGEQTTLGGIAFRGLNEPYAASVGVVNPKVETMAIFGGRVETDHQVVNKRGDKARASQIAARLRKAGLFFDRGCILGDPTTNPKEFYGLKKRLTGNQVIWSGSGDNGGFLDTDLLDQLLDKVTGPNNRKVLLMCKEDRRILKGLILRIAGGASVADFVSGEVQAYDGARIEVIDEDGDETPILAKNEVRGTSQNTSSIYCIRPGESTDDEFVQGLVGSKMIEQYDGGMNGNMHVDIVEMHGGLAVFHGRAAARLGGLWAWTAPPDA